MPDLKDEIVNKSFFQFLNRGYKACSLKDLEKATGLTKGAFYYYFRNNIPPILHSRRWDHDFGSVIPNHTDRQALCCDA